MTVETSINTVFANGNETATVFSFAPLTISDASEMTVSLVEADGTETMLVNGTDYTVSVPSYPGIGNVIYPPTGAATLATGERLMMRRVVALTQTVELDNQGGYFPEIQEGAFDKATMIAIQQQEQLSAAIKVPLSAAPGINTQTPTIAAGQILAVNETGDGFEFVDQPSAGATGAQGPKGDKGDTGASGAGTGDMVAAQNLSDVANAATSRTNLGVAIGTDVQAYSAGLAVLAALTFAANKIVKWTAAGAAALIDFLDEDDMASNSTSAVPSQASVKAYVDAAIAGGGSVWNTGDCRVTMRVTAASGWVIFNDGTLGDASSSATTRANADTADLYALLWAITVQADCPVTGGRGSSAAADFAAHKAIALPKLVGRALSFAGQGSGLTFRQQGSSFGEEKHTMTLGEIFPHTHNNNNGNISGYSVASDTGSGFGVDNSKNFATSSTGSGTPFNVIQPTSCLFNAEVKL